MLIKNYLEVYELLCEINFIKNKTILNSKIKNKNKII